MDELRFCLLAAFVVLAQFASEVKAAELDSPHGFVLSYPATWSEREAPSAVRYTAHYLKSQQGSAYIWIKVSEKGQLDRADGDGIAYLQDRFRLFGPSVATLGGLKWVTFELGASGKKERIYTRLENGRIYSFNCGSSESSDLSAKSTQDDITAILSSVRFQAPRAIPAPKAEVAPPQRRWSGRIERARKSRAEGAEWVGGAC
jgi:hypothetical protein